MWPWFNCKFLSIIQQQPAGHRADPALRQFKAIKQQQVTKQQLSYCSQHLFMSCLRQNIGNSNHPVPGSSFEFCLGKTYFLWVKRILPMIYISEYSWIWIRGVPPPLRPRLIASLLSPCIQIWLETAFVKPTSIKSFPFHNRHYQHYM